MNRRNPSSSPSGQSDEERDHRRLPDPCNHPPLHMQQQLPSTNHTAGAERGQIMASAAMVPSSAGGRNNPPAAAVASSDTFDPWALYGGNIAAACMATNDTVTAQIVKGETSNEDTDLEKQKQRASSRLTAWQSRERKRIEIEVLDERKQELGDRNKILKKENEQLKAFIQRLKASISSGNSSTDFHTTLGAASSLPSSNAQHQHDRRTAASPASTAPSQLLPQAQPRARRAAALALNESSLVGANLSRIHRQAVAAAASLQQHQQRNPLLSASFHHHSTAASHCLSHSFLQQAGAGGPSSSSTTGGTNILRRGGLADPPPRPPSLLLSPPATQTTVLPIQRLIGAGNDIIAPTVFAPLQRGGDHHGQQQHQTHQTLATQYQQLLQQQAQGMLPRGGLVSTTTTGPAGAGGGGGGGNPGCLPLSLSSLITPPTTTTGDVDIPLLRAVQQKRKQAPPQHDCVNKDAVTFNKKAKRNNQKVSSPLSSPSTAGSDGPT